MPELDKEEVTKIDNMTPEEQQKYLLDMVEFDRGISAIYEQTYYQHRSYILYIAGLLGVGK